MRWALRSRGALRIAGFAAVTAATNVRFRLASEDPLVRARITQSWGRGMCRACGIRVEVVGTPADSHGALVVANHRSYADIAALGSCAPMTFIAKTEIRDWPVLGPAATRAGTIYVRRGDARSGATALRQARDLIARGVTVAVFPEGTTRAGPGIGAFELGAFRLAAAARIPVVPVAIEYARPTDAWTDPDDSSFLSHFLSTFGRRAVHVRIAFGERLSGQKAEPLRAEAVRWIETHLATPSEGRHAAVSV